MLKTAITVSLFLAAALGASAKPAAADKLIIGVVAPVDGPYALLGRQLLDGARFRAAQLGNTIVAIDDGCVAEGGAAMAEALIEAKVAAATGFLCTESLEAALPKLKEAGIPALSLGVRSGVLMEDALKNGWPLFRLGPSQAAEIEKLADVIATEWSAEPFALVDDGALNNHDLVESLRAALEAQGVRPVLTDTLRPGQQQQLTLVRHLSSAGVARAFVAADRDDVAIVAKDLKTRNLPITIMAGALVATTPGTVPLPSGVQALVLKDPARDPAHAELAASLRSKGIEPEGYVLPSLAAQDVADMAVADATAGGTPVAEALLARAFDTAAGPVRFTEKHELTENPYDVLEWTGTAFAPRGAQ